MQNREFPLASPAADPSQREIYSISRLAGEVRGLLERGFPEIWVEGEVTNLSRAGSGHWYFSLKDATAEVRCALFRNRADLLDTTPLSDGNSVLARVRVTLYEPRGAFQLIVQHLEDAGEGALRRAFEELKLKLFNEGLFEDATKKTLPSFPATVGMITSPSGAALHDLVTTFKRRCPGIRLILYPTSVQGERAPAEIIAALVVAQQRLECDVLILARGGGSLEDLKAFNSEEVARAVFNCEIPIVCGVGHEIDLTICDMVADQRAATPTAAAELVSPDRVFWLKVLSGLSQRLYRNLQHHLQTRIQRSDELGRRLLHPNTRLERGRERLHNILKSLQHLITRRLQQPTIDLARLEVQLSSNTPQRSLLLFRQTLADANRRINLIASQTISLRLNMLEHMAARLNNVSPLATLNRGFAIASRPDTGQLIRDPKDAPVGQSINIRLARGGMACKVEKHDP